MINLSSNFYVFLPSVCPQLHLFRPQLAQQGMNVVIISRSRADLDLVARGISKNVTYICSWMTSHLRLVRVNNMNKVCQLLLIIPPTPTLCIPLSSGENTGKRVKVIAADLTKDDVFEEIERELKDLNIGVLG